VNEEGVSEVKGRRLGEEGRRGGIKGAIIYNVCIVLKVLSMLEFELSKLNLH